MHSLLLLLLMFLISPQSMADDPFHAWHFQCDPSHYTPNTTFETNLNNTFQTLITSSLTTGYSNATIGQDPNQVFGLYLCRGDTNGTSCQTCLKQANTDVRINCSDATGATVWYDYCTVYYSQQVLSLTDNSIQNPMSNPNKISSSDVDRFTELLTRLMNATADYAVINSTTFFGTGQMSGFTDSNPIIYGYAQCTPDMGKSECRLCLQRLLDQILNTDLHTRQGGRVLGVRCSMEFEFNQFFQVTSSVKLEAATASPPSPSPPLSSSSPPGKNKTTTIVLATAIPAAAAIIIMLVIIYICYRRKKTTSKVPYEPDEEDVARAESILYSSSTLRAATADFADENKLGQGGFGVVYKGFLPDGSVIAVKKLLTSSNQGFEQLKNELVLVAKLQHRNLVRLLGVCWEVEKLLVYEYVPNGSLEKFIFDPLRRQELQWGTRFKIIGGIARGLQYLHEESQLKIIHRDLKASNILLDGDMNPKISDFGLAKLFRYDQSQANTHQVVGTFGYMAPEYVTQGVFSSKSDVFSFGVLVLEIVSGRTNGNSDESENSEGLLSYTWEKWTRGTAIDLIDRAIVDSCPTNEVLKCIHIALLCVQENPADRPSMSTVIVMLSSSTVTLQPPSRPPFVYGMSSIASVETYSESDTHDGSSIRIVEIEQNKMSLSEIEAR